jgi:putative FmdB family regulatory protein
MPMYEYGCLSCSSRFDRLRRMEQSDTDITCPRCQSASVERRLSVFAAHSRGASAMAGASEVSSAPPASGGCCGGACGCGSRAA